MGGTRSMDSWKAKRVSWKVSLQACGYIYEILRDPSLGQLWAGTHDVLEGWQSETSVDFKNLKSDICTRTDPTANAHKSPTVFLTVLKLWLVSVGRASLLSVVWNELWCTQQRAVDFCNWSEVPARLTGMPESCACTRACKCMCEHAATWSQERKLRRE